MAEELHIASGGKEEKYKKLIPQIRAVVKDESDLIANMANISAMLCDTFRHWWVGFYRVAGQELVLGPFQGPLACTRIARGRGVCGTAWEKEETVIVPDVNQFPGHIACSSLSRSEIVVPVWHNEEVIAVLDIDSTEQGAFDASDAYYLQQITQLLAEHSQH